MTEAQEYIAHSIRILRGVQSRELSDQKQTIEGVIWHLERYIEQYIAPSIYGDNGEMEGDVEQHTDAMPAGYEEYVDEEAGRCPCEKEEDYCKGKPIKIPEVQMKELD